MSDPFVAEIRVFGFNFAPTGWAMCNGQLLPISQNTALFSLLGTYYGGDGKSTFGLPNLQENVPIGTGPGPGGSERYLGEQSGSQNVTLLSSEIAAHSHQLRATAQDATATNGVGQMLAMTRHAVYEAPGTPVLMNAQSGFPSGGSGFPHNNLQPYLVLNYCIAMQGIYPARP